MQKILNLKFSKTNILKSCFGVPSAIRENFMVIVKAIFKLYERDEQKMIYDEL